MSTSLGIFNSLFMKTHTHAHTHFRSGLKVQICFLSLAYISADEHINKHYNICYIVMELFTKRTQTVYNLQTTTSSFLIAAQYCHLPPSHLRLQAHLRSMNASWGKFNFYVDQLNQVYKMLLGSM